VCVCVCKLGEVVVVFLVFDSDEGIYAGAFLVPLSVNINMRNLETRLLRSRATLGGNTPVEGS